MVENYEKGKIAKKQKIPKKEVENEEDILLNISNKDKKIEVINEEPTLENKNFESEIFSKDTSFKELGVCDELCDVLNSLNYKYPTKIQKETLQYTLKNKDVIGLAETGSGKTAAYSIPIIQSLLENPSPFYALILAPTRELCIQISQNLNALGASIGLKTVTLVGGLNDVEQAIQISKNPHISDYVIKLVIGSPGRVVYHLTSTKGFSLRNIKYLVFDEADKILDADFEDQVNKILENINKKRNTFLFSATMTTKVHKLEKASLVDPVKIEVNTKYSTVPTLVQNYLFIPARYKECYLGYILNQFVGSSIIVFVETCIGSIRIALLLRNLGFKAIAINGKMNQSNRLGALNKFKSNERNILIATDVASRGLDIPNVDLVINYDVPQSPKDYIHRVGRTARAGKTGRSICFVTQYDVENYQKIEFFIEKKLDEYKLEEKSVLSIYERILEATRFANQELKEITKKLSKNGLVDGNADDQEENNPFQNFTKNKRNFEKNLSNKSFVKKKKTK